MFENVLLTLTQLGSMQFSSKKEEKTTEICRKRIGILKSPRLGMCLSKRRDVDYLLLPNYNHTDQAVVFVI